MAWVFSWQLDWVGAYFIPGIRSAELARSASKPARGLCATGSRCRSHAAERLNARRKGSCQVSSGTGYPFSRSARRFRHLRILHQQKHPSERFALLLAGSGPLALQPR